jgi:hypothetical protein
VVREIPEESRKQIVDAALKVFAPVTELTGGVGELIAAQFTTWHRLHQIRAAEILKAAGERSRCVPRLPPHRVPRVICSALCAKKFETTACSRLMQMHAVKLCLAPHRGPPSRRSCSCCSMAKRARAQYPAFQPTPVGAGVRGRILISNVAARTGPLLARAASTDQFDGPAQRLGIESMDEAVNRSHTVSGSSVPDSTPEVSGFRWSTLPARMARRPVAGLAGFRSNLSHN